MRFHFLILRFAVLIVFMIIHASFCYAPTGAADNNQPVVQAYPKGYFRNPLDIPIKLAANFGELRTNHFHMGLDIRTNQRENLPVYAAAEGYISKIKIEKSGFGRAIYITHPNGFTTLYAHLNAFYPALNEYVISKQYADQSWEQEFALSPGQFPVSKGQFIAYSGNTGGSAGPHLHFEIRDTRTGNNLNPWLFDMGLPDNIPPVLYRLYYYDRRQSTYEAAPLPIALKGGGGVYTSGSPVVTLSSPYVSFGITAEDKTTPSSFNFGIYEASLTIDDTLRSQFRLNDISYNDTRYLNASIDYKNRLSGGSYIQHLSRLPGNKLSIFEKGSNGAFLIRDSSIHRAIVQLKDAEGNSSVLQFAFRCVAPKSIDAVADDVVVLAPNQENVFAAEDVMAAFSPRAFYDTVHFVHQTVAANYTDAVSLTHQLHNFKVPVHDSFSVRIKPTQSFANEWKDKVVMKMVSNKKNDTEKCIWKGEWAEARFRDFGNFTLILDTIPPRVSLYGWVNGAYVGGRAGFAFAASDNMELKSANAYVDGQWILCSKKDNLLIHTFDGHIAPGKHTLLIEAEDVAGNVTSKEFTFTR